VPRHAVYPTEKISRISVTMTTAAGNAGAVAEQHRDRIAAGDRRQRRRGETTKNVMAATPSASFRSGRSRGWCCCL